MAKRMTPEEFNEAARRLGLKAHVGLDSSGGVLPVSKEGKPGVDAGKKERSKEDDDVDD